MAASGSPGTHLAAGMTSRREQWSAPIRLAVLALVALMATALLFFAALQIARLAEVVEVVA